MFSNMVFLSISKKLNSCAETRVLQRRDKEPSGEKGPQGRKDTKVHGQWLFLYNNNGPDDPPQETVRAKRTREINRIKPP